eukprot:3776904-Amphidinium_carterae.1
MAYEQLVGGHSRLTDDLFNTLAYNEQLMVPCDVVTDAWSLYQSLSLNNSRIPDDKSLILVLSSLREHFASGRIRNVGWCATHQMLADGLSKSTISKEGLSRLSNEGVYQLSTAIWHR